MAAEIEAANPRPRQVVRMEIFHVLRRGGLIGAEDLIMLARAEGLSNQEILRLVRNWNGRHWPER
jgi:hypothetical protein